MKYCLSAFLFILFTHFTCTGQFSDDFSDGNLNGWQGNTDHFIVNPDFQLQLNAPSGNTNSWIYITTPFIDSMVWEMYIKLGFAPSTSNQLRIYLGLTTSDFATASGYYLEIGASGDTDPLDLKYLENGIAQTIASSVPGLVGTEPVELKLRIERNQEGQWQCFETGGGPPELLFSTQHDLLPLSTLQVFGFYCKYTDTRRDKFFMDDISVLPLVADNTPPSLIDFVVTDANTLMLTFDEPLDPLSVIDPGHYVLSPGNTTPQQVNLNSNEVILEWAQPFISQETYTLSITNISDQSGNILVSDSRNFTFTQIDEAQEFELLITEIMADPTPIVGLPEAEYIEVYNNSSKIFDLSDYTLRIGTSERSLPDSLIDPGEYVIITDDATTSLLQPFGRVVVLESFPSITNGGVPITLLTSTDVILHEVKFNLDWYGDTDKSDGGWSLEMKNLLHRCADQLNWGAASNLIGGTPGTQNSQWTTTPDVTGPQLISLFTGLPDIIELRFDEKIDEVLMSDPGLYHIDPAINITSIELVNPTTIHLHLSQLLQEGIIYQLLPLTAFDCIGNISVSPDTIHFGLTSNAEAGDILINEILFNPASGGSRFIEVINASQKFIDLNTLAIGRIDATHNDIYPTGINEILGPGEIAVFTPEPADILSRYTVPNPGRLYQATLPSWDDMSDQVSIISLGMIIDSFTYSSSWHHPVISDQNGVSLERISGTQPASSPFNWHSASSVAGYATPTGPNSQAVTSSGSGNPFSILHNRFSPNDDGINDFLAIQFEHESGNDVASVWIYDLEGREVLQILSNETPGTTGTVVWDGRNTEGLLADMGIYIIFIQLWDAAGKVSEYQETCALIKR